MTKKFKKAFAIMLALALSLAVLSGVTVYAGSGAPAWVPDVAAKVDAVASNLYGEMEGQQVTLSDLVSGIGGSFSDFCDYMNDKDYSQEGSVYSYIGTFGSSQATVVVTLNYKEEVIKTEVHMLHDSGATEDYVFTPNHNHSLTYSANGRVLTAACNQESCALKDGKIELAFDATASVYKGLTGLEEFNKETGKNIKASDVKFYQVNMFGMTTGGTALSAEPTIDGYYYAELTVEGATAKHAFTVITTPTMPNKETASNDVATSPKTGDSNNSAVLYLILVASLGGMFVLIRSKKRV